MPRQKGKPKGYTADVGTPVSFRAKADLMDALKAAAELRGGGVTHHQIAREWCEAGAAAWRKSQAKAAKTHGGGTTVPP